LFIRLNDTDVETETANLVITNLGTPSNGTVLNNNNGTVTYTHDGSETTSDSFTYTINDGANDSLPGTVSITVNPPNASPVANDDFATVTEGSAENIDLRLNDTDVDTDQIELTITNISTPANGSVTNNNDGTVTYTHNGSETTSDSFTYTSNDGSSNSNAATVAITITAVNDLPIAVADNETVAQGSSNTLSIRLNDTDAETVTVNLTITNLSTPSHGVLVNNNDGTVTYTHDNSETISDSFTYTINDGIADSAPATVSIAIINSKSGAPIGTDDTGVLDEGSSAIINLLINDTDIDTPQSELTVTNISTAANGTVVNNNNGTVTYSHDGSETTTDSFTYTANDGTTNSAVVNVFLTIDPINDRPVANTDSDTVIKGSSKIIDIRANDTDAETLLNNLTVTNISTPANGSVVNNNDGTVTYTHNASKTSNDSFTYTINDGTTDSAPAQVSINILVVNIGPVLATLPTSSVEELSLLTLDIGAALTDPDDNNDNSGDIQWRLIDPPLGMSISTLGNILWTPGENSVGNYIITVIAEDGLEDNASAAEQTYNIDVTLLDGDGDTVADYSDNCPLNNNELQLDLDADGQGDVCDDDIDGDGLDNDFEIANNLDPLNDIDATLDTDGDGLSDLEESLICIANNQDICSTLLVDNNPPTISTVDLIVPATGYYTTVELIASAFDITDGNVTPTTDDSSVLRPGRNIINWTATDSNNNVGTTQHVINVLPIVTLAGSVIVSEGQTVSIPFNLNGDAADYPVIISYTLSGTAEVTDHNLVAGSLIIESGLQGNIVIDIIEDSIVENDEDLIITLSSINNNAVLSEELTYTIRVTEKALAPIVNLAITQNGISSNTIYVDAGIVELTAEASGGNGDTLIFDWSNSPSDINATIDTNRFSFDPNTDVLQTSDYLIEVIVSDGTLHTIASLPIHIETTAPVLSRFRDSDNDGVNDLNEGLSDTDKDGIADYLDAINDQSLLPTDVILNNNSFQNLMETQKGFALKMGRTALGTNEPGAKISSQDIVDDTNSVIEDQGSANFGGLFDFEIHGLTEIEPTAVLVIPLDQFIPQDNATYRKFINGIWTDFVVNGQDKIRSAQKVDGFCPAPLSNIYQDGILKFSQCIELSITDGGPNDDDGIINGVIKDPSGVSVGNDSNQKEEPAITPTSSSEGAGQLPMILLLLLVLLLIVRQTKTRNDRVL
jgi:VCBS repeat-containing protein